MSYLSNSELASNQKAVPMWPLDQDGFETWTTTADATQRRWVEQAGFTAAAGELCAVPDTDGALGGAAVLVYLAAYTLMNIGAFAAVAVMSERENEPHLISDLAGQGWKRPVVVS